MVKRILAWAQRNERHLGAALFVWGFGTDLLTFALLDISFVNLAFAAYLALAVLATLGSHALYARTPEGPEPAWRRAGKVLLPLAAQYAFGSLLSGFLIFYTKSSVLTVSWPFLLVLALVFFGNEVFRKYKDRLAFQAVLLFFSFYAYVLFALPLLVHTLGPLVFLGSSAIAIIGFLLFVGLLYVIGHTRLKESFRRILLAAGVIVLVVVGSYFTGLLPPLPLTMPEGGIYHRLARVGGSYVVQAEMRAPWYRAFLGQTVHVRPGEPLYAYSAVAAPIRFSTSIEHRWEHYEEATRSWDERAVIAFPVSGGRASGYRGYSELTGIAPGKWRVSVETLDGQVIGRIRFTAVMASEPPVLHEETH